MTSSTQPTQLFSSAEKQGERYWIATEFFNAVYSQGRFLWMLPTLADRSGCVIDEVNCSFPDPKSVDPDDHFFGVKFGVLDDEVILSNADAYAVLVVACENYLRIHPAHRLQVEALLAECHWG